MHKYSYSYVSMTNDYADGEKKRDQIKHKTERKGLQRSAHKILPKLTQTKNVLSKKCDLKISFITHTDKLASL